MKKLGSILMTLLIVITASIPGQSLPHRQQLSGSVRETDLELVLLLPKKTYKSNEQLKFQVMLRNASESDLYLWGTLGWGYSSSLMFYLRDSAGKNVEPTLIPDSPPQAPQEDKSYYVKLLPENFLGTSYFAPLRLMNLSKPGKYSLFVEYRGLFPKEEVPVAPFWGKERGTIRSNVVSIEVIR